MPRRPPIKQKRPAAKAPPVGSSLAALPKLSDLLTTFAAPVFDALPEGARVDDVRTALYIAEFCWNTPLLRRHTAPENIADLAAEIDAQVASMPRELRQIVESLMAERVGRYGNDPRLITKVEVRGRAGNYNVRAEWTVPTSLRGAR